MDKIDESGILPPMVTPLKDITEKWIDVSMDIGNGVLGEEARADAMVERDREMVDMTTEDNPMGEEARAAKEAKIVVEMNTEDDPTGWKAKAVEAAKTIT